LELALCAIFFGCASANLPAARKRSVASQRSLLFMAFALYAMDMPQNSGFENHNLWMKTGRGRLILVQGSSKFDSLQWWDELTSFGTSWT
jgi:hypothetical protein